MTGSMSRKSDCLDNAVTKRFFRSLKAERLITIGITDWEIYRRMNMNADYNNVSKSVFGFF